MKKLLTLAALVSLFIFGCNEETSFVSPVDGSSNQSVNWITLPTPSDMSVNSTSFNKSKLIDGQIGGKVNLKTIYQGGPFGLVKIDSKLEIPSNAFDGSVEISTTVFPEEGLVQFGPSMVFDRDLEYDLTYEGIDLTGVNPQTVKFCYIAADGSVIEAENEGIEIDFSSGKIKVSDALIPHFSRYGFVN